MVLKDCSISQEIHITPPLKPSHVGSIGASWDLIIFNLKVNNSLLNGSSTHLLVQSKVVLVCLVAIDWNAKVTELVSRFAACDSNQNHSGKDDFVPFRI